MRRLGWLCLLLAACSQAWDWRELQLATGAATARFACKPASQTRELPWPGSATPLPTTLWACEHGGVTQAVTLANVGDPAQVGPTLRAWREAALRNFQADGTGSRAPWGVPRATPQPDAGLWRLKGRRADGGALNVQTALAARGTWVLQATLLSPEPIAPDVTQAFFEGIAFGL